MHTRCLRDRRLPPVTALEWGTVRQMVSRREVAHPWARSATLLAAVVILAFGGWLRASTWPWHTNLWAIDWLSYYEPQAEALARFRLWSWLGSWEGLHPPVSGVVHGTLMTLGVPLGGQWIATTIAGLAAIALLARGVARERPLGGAFALLVVLWASLSPLQANYGLNTSPYPWTLLLVSGSTMALIRARDSNGRRAWIVAAVWMGLAVETHVLALSVAIGQVLWLGAQGPSWVRSRRSHLTRWALIVGAFSVPMLIGALTKTSDPWTFHVEEGAEPWFRTAGLVLHERFGARSSAIALGGALSLFAMLGAALKPRGMQGLLAISILGWMTALLLFIKLGVADPRLSHYYLVPQALGLAAGAVGAMAVGDRAPRWARGRAHWVLLSVLSVLSAFWVTEGLQTQFDRRSRAEKSLDDASAVRTAVSETFRVAGQGDVVAYLWDHEFLNDEPDYMDPYAAWPLGKVGRRCREEHPPRGLCNVSGGARFYFDPSAFSGPLWELEEPLRLMVNQASPPGRARFILLPGSGAPPRPFPAEVWMREQGASARNLGDGVTVWEFPVGARVPPPTTPLKPPRAE